MGELLFTVCAGAVLCEILLLLISGSRSVFQQPMRLLLGLFFLDSLCRSALELKDLPLPELTPPEQIQQETAEEFSAYLEEAVLRQAEEITAERIREFLAGRGKRIPDFRVRCILAENGSISGITIEAEDGMAEYSEELQDVLGIPVRIVERDGTEGWSS